MPLSRSASMDEARSETNVEIHATGPPHASSLPYGNRPALGIR